jgi:hypothetical protein
MPDFQELEGKSGKKLRTSGEEVGEKPTVCHALGSEVNGKEEQ